MTDRLLAAIENPYTQILGHPTGRLLLRREEYPYDMERILNAAKKYGVAVECNAAPERLDLKDVYLRMAKERGVGGGYLHGRAYHACAFLDAFRRGMARRGWLEKKDVLNTCRWTSCWRLCDPNLARTRSRKPRGATAAKVRSAKT